VARGALDPQHAELADQVAEAASDPRRRESPLGALLRPWAAVTISRHSDLIANILKDSPRLARISLMAPGVSLFGVLNSLFLQVGNLLVSH
jgi:hypothetical protein